MCGVYAGRYGAESSSMLSLGCLQLRKI
uniref:Uncharacterized protein n=1 Tax=Rhizophora mucronata TaxID=61149 RepID=A0A2P2PXK1_RHIMU